MQTGLRASELFRLRGQDIVLGSWCSPPLSSFAVHRLTSWYQQGADVQKLLPYLATYLGHVSIAATQVYLTMTSELLHAASVRFERYALQEVRHD